MAEFLLYYSGCSAVGSAPHLGCGCRVFESRHSDHKPHYRVFWGLWCGFVFHWCNDSLRPLKYRSGRREISSKHFSLYGCCEIVNNTWHILFKQISCSKIQAFIISSSFLLAHILSHLALSWHLPPELFMLWTIPYFCITVRYSVLVMQRNFWA